MNTKRIKRNWLYLLAGVVIFALGTLMFLELNHYPEVKKSIQGVCHTKESRYYFQTLSFSAFWTVEACVEAGGRVPDGDENK